MSRLPFPAVTLDQWPVLDRKLWLASHQAAGLFDNGGLAARWRPATSKGSERGYGVYLHWLTSTDRLDPQAHPCERVTQERIRTFIDAYGARRSELTVAGTVRGIAYVLRACAPPDGALWLTRLAHRMVNTAKRSRPKLPRMARVSEILALAYRLMEAGLDGVRQGRAGAAPFHRDGLMMALLIQRPMRRRNLAALRIGGSILFNDRDIRIHFSREETKKGTAIDWRVPRQLAPAFETYLAEIRPILLRHADDDGWLWLGRRGRRMAETDISTRVSKLTKKYLGRQVSPHLFRDCAATEIALEDPRHVGITKSVLGHATLASSQKFYNQATSFSAFARHQYVIRGMRDAD